MQNLLFRFYLSAFLFLFFFLQNDYGQYNNIQIDYFGQTLPGDSAVVFAPDFISREGWYVQNGCFSQSGKEFCFVKTDSAWTKFSVMYTHYENGKWTEPVELFPGEKYLGMPFFSYSDSILYFSNSLTDLYHGGDIYTSKRTSSGWTKPEKFLSPVNSEDGNEWEICESRNGTLYFSSTRKGAKGVDNYISRLEDGKYIYAENLGKPLNTVSLEECPYIAPDESFFIFNSWRYNPKYPGNNIYISYKQNDNTWSDMKDLGGNFNTDDLDLYPYITPDGKYFLFTRRSYLKNTGYSKIFWASTSFLKKLKKSTDTSFKNINLLSEELDKYLGIYSNPQIPVKLSFSKEENVLMLQAAGQQPTPAEAIEKDIFSAGGYIFKFYPEKQEVSVSVQGGNEIGNFIKEKQQ